MDFRNLGIYVLLVLMSSCKPCDDPYGSNLELVVPIQFDNGDIVRVGDTISLKITFSKDVHLFEKEDSIFLENFNFFSSFGIINISDSIQRFNTDIKVMDLIGITSRINLPTSVSYAIEFEELPEKYQYHSKLIINNPGLFFFEIGSNSLILEGYDHPAMFECGKHRGKSHVYYLNSGSSYENYSAVLKSTPEDFYQDLSYEAYLLRGGYAFNVI